MCYIFYIYIFIKLIHISYIIIVIAFIMFILETLIANILFNYPINYKNLGLLFVITIIAFFPYLQLFSRIDKL